MLIYAFVLAVPGVLAVLAPRTRSPGLVILVLSVVVVFIGLREGIGPDWQQYQYIHSRVLDETLTHLFTRAEPLSYALFWMDARLEMNMLLTNVIAALILVYGVLRLSLSTRQPWISFVAAAPYLVFIFGMSGIRQGMAVGVLFLALAKWKDLSLFGRVVYVALASLFHASALVGGLLILAGVRVHLLVKVILAGLISGAIFFATSTVDVYSQSFEQYDRVYLEDTAQVFSAGALLHLLLVIAPAVLGIIFYRRIRPYCHDAQLLKYGLIAAGAILAIYFVQTTVASRLSLYLYFVPIMVYSPLIESLRARDRPFARLAIVSMSMAVLLVWLRFGNHVEAYLPYRNVLI